LGVNPVSKPTEEKSKVTIDSVMGVSNEEHAVTEVGNPMKLGRIRLW